MESSQWNNWTVIYLMQSLSYETIKDNQIRILFLISYKKHWNQ